MSPLEAWQRLCEGYEADMPASTDEHTGWGVMATEPAYRFTPPYFNGG